MDLSRIPEFLIPSWNTKDENGLENFISALESTVAMGVTTDTKLEDIRLGHKNLESPDTNRAVRSKRSRGEL